MMRMIVRLAIMMMMMIASAVVPQAFAQGSAPPVAEQAGPRLLVMLRMPPPHAGPGVDYGGGYGDAEGRNARHRIAVRLARKLGGAVVDEWPMPLLGVDCFVFSTPKGGDADAAARRLAADTAVSWSEPEHLYHAQEEATHNDPLYRAQPAAQEWRLADLHRISTGRDVRVAVIDSMIERAHPDLVGRVELVENFVDGRPDPPEVHGTAVAGIIAAQADNHIGIAGIAPDARLMGLRACWQEPGEGAGTVCDSLSLAKALEFAVEHKAQVINMSLSGPSDLLLSRLIGVAQSRGAVVVAAYDRSQTGGGFPASQHGVIAVTDEESGPAPPGVVSAPGREVPTTEPGGRWSVVNGSSFAAAHISGLFALMRQRTPLLQSTSALILAPPGSVVDACATLLQRHDPCHCECSRSNAVVASAAR
jgi:subtilisin family serine protease